MFTLKHEGKYFILRNEPIASGRRFGDSMNAGRPMELGARSCAIAVAAALFFLVVGAALGQQDATTPTQTEKGTGNQKEGGQANGTRSPEEAGGAGKA